MPASTLVVQEAGNPRRPSISTRQTRQEPKDLSWSVAQRRGIFTPLSAAARITEVPSGTVTLTPSILKVTMVVLVLFGVP